VRMTVFLSHCRCILCRVWSRIPSPLKDRIIVGPVFADTDMTSSYPFHSYYCPQAPIFVTFNFTHIATVIRFASVFRIGLHSLMMQSMTSPMLEWPSDKWGIRSHAAYDLKEVLPLITCWLYRGTTLRSYLHCKNCSMWLSALSSSSCFRNPEYYHNI